jgi:hypothetical protein
LSVSRSQPSLGLTLRGTMAKKPETIFKEKKVCPALDKIPKLYYTKIQQVAIRGTPDILICYNGKFFAWELKVSKNKASGLQNYEIYKIKRAGGIARVVTPATLEEAIQEILDA